ncbi:SIS domain-containing protein [Prochlorococcus sp. MIT 1300]|uniref:D-sedoheptulose-7-phosphate isomerase n=1 Tax=Prochlorococcus sp. MIT 1300 TaxID=3096218 RepID=UPI002A76442C|nr:SIS domain-containing protein [Prochlorococcus sp. MIT 1300]
MMINHYLEYLTGFQEALTLMKTKEYSGSIIEVAELIIDTVKERRPILICGNGGSAADASHIAAELVCRFESNREPLKAISLTTDTSLLTAIGNDLGYERVFSRQVEALGEAGGLLWVISTSGKSPNIKLAIKAAKAIGMKVLLMTGNNVPLELECDYVINAPSQRTAYIQELHRLVYHFICLEVERSLPIS